MPLQKSFSEQNGSFRNRHRWQKSKSHSAVGHSSAVTNTNTRPLEPVSAITKNKLNTFNFRPTSDHSQGKTLATSNGEPQRAEQPSDENPVKTRQSVERDAEELASLVAPKNNTTTPVSRLAWQDLVNMSEVQEEEEDASPSDRLGWDTRDHPTYKLSPVMSRKRGKKRARSSSPTSSPAAISKSNTPAINVKRLSEALKSPHADPALELWDRFSLSGSTSTTSLGAKNPALAQIMVSSSPQPSRVIGGAPSEGGLRRAISCGANWPKRRRVERTEAGVAMGAIIDESPSRNSKSSMVNALLQSVTGEINKSKAVQVRHEGLRSPSPRKKRQGPAEETFGSPIRRRSPTNPPPPLFAGGPTEKMERSKSVSQMGTDNSSDYGDEDFDDDALMELDAKFGSTQQEPSILPHPPDTGQPADQVPGPESNESNLIDEFADEFADLDDDVFAAAEDLVLQIDSAHAPQHKSDGPAPPTVVNEPVSGAGTQDLAEDIYGDDFDDDFDFEAAEIAATQSVKQAKGSITLPAHKPKAIQRYLVTKVLQSQYIDSHGREVPEKVRCR
ncbi:hypothetical protein F5X99DRAFT_391621 [Biscogniauxia marginata]|nr:hypothetical protein F5X99DRAFT_391621 [Biscogniauxia marginata]